MTQLDCALAATNIGSSAFGSLSRWINLAISDRNIVVSWTTNVPGFLLQRRDDLAATNWLYDSTPVQVVGDQNTATEPADQAARFFRLIQP